ncbi:hypothetical protein SCP_0308850 [Sparassis crispa]|uniref:Uncharacterized protein n=1 Tax=Sparassis crispa TaxID=139825 RepID=A0A401GG66_9APHY|nr:hypothetical protein SCP_0308850 [Sparassis crispa]GBE81159.1 hypothetical protein SCP_0308850 [Sparassis crispa]
MPPEKAKAKTAHSTSRDLVPVGPRHLSAKNQTKRDENGDKPTTARALVLRNGKYGARGTGELMAMGKMSGREKLDLLAEDLIERSKKALGTPFRLERCINMGDSQLSAQLDDISNLQDPDLFYDKIKTEVLAREPRLGKDAPDPLRSRDKVVPVVASRIHNAYMMAAAWRLVVETLSDLAEEGLEDSPVKSQLKKSAGFRGRYLVLYDIVNTLAQAAQAKFALLATTAPHYEQYFKVQVADGKREYIFDWDGLKAVHKSFLDSIIVELCLPESAIPRQVLYQILHEAIEESPRDAKLFPQAVWDAVGDLSVIVQLLEMLESPLLGPEGETWKKETRKMPEEFEDWADAQIFSARASEKYANYADMIFPLEKTKSRHVLDNMWRQVDRNYEAVCGMDVDSLWQLKDIRHRAPQWHAVRFSGNSKSYDSDSDGGRPKSKGSRGMGSKGRRLPAIMNGPADDSDADMPDLQSVSDSSSEYQSESDDDEDEYDEDEDESGGSEDGYDTDEEDALRDMLREAMDTAAATPDFFDPKSPAPEFEALAEERKGNPFLKLLGSLRGRMFSSNPTLKTTPRTEPRHPFAPGKTGAVPRPTPVPPSPAPSPKSRKATVEAVEDEEELAAAAKKKKKKPKKKKKSATAAAGQEPVDVANGAATEPTSVQAPPVIVTPPTQASKANGQANTPSSTKKFNAPKTPAKPPAVNASTTSLPHVPLSHVQTAQSAHSYLTREGLMNQKAKVKAKRDPLTPVPEKKGLFSRFRKDKSKDKEKDAEAEESKKGSKFSFFSRLTKRAREDMHKLLGTSEDETKGIQPMKWESFLKLMREMGFEYDPSTAGSSVRFDPPDPRDVPITFHRPHPDPTLYPILLKEFSKKLKRQYGWCEEDFYR